MLAWDVILALLISGLALWYTIYRDRSSDINELEARVSEMEKQSALQRTAIDRLEKNQSELDEVVRGIQSQIHSMDVKLEKMLTILEQQEMQRQYNKRD